MIYNLGIVPIVEKKSTATQTTPVWIQNTPDKKLIDPRSIPLYIAGAGIVAIVYFLSGKKTWTIPVSLAGVWVLRFPLLLGYAIMTGQSMSMGKYR